MDGRAQLGGRDHGSAGCVEGKKFAPAETSGEALKSARVTIL